MGGGQGEGGVQEVLDAPDGKGVGGGRGGPGGELLADCADVGPGWGVSEWERGRGGDETCQWPRRALSVRAVAAARRSASSVGERKEGIIT